MDSVIHVPWDTTPYALPLAQYGLWTPPLKNFRKRPSNLTWANVVGYALNEKSGKNRRNR